jgi:hypothetical protein
MRERAGRRARVCRSSAAQPTASLLGAATVPFPGGRRCADKAPAFADRYARLALSAGSHFNGTCRAEHGSDGRRPPPKIIACFRLEHYGRRPPKQGMSYAIIVHCSVSQLGLRPVRHVVARESRLGGYWGRAFWDAGPQQSSPITAQRRLRVTLYAAWAQQLTRARRLPTGRTIGSDRLAEGRDPKEIVMRHIRSAGTVRPTPASSEPKYQASLSKPSWMSGRTMESIWSSLFTPIASAKSDTSKRRAARIASSFCVRSIGVTSAGQESA